MSVAKDFIDALKSTQKKTKPADDDAVVRRIEGSIAWVHIPGGVDETPVQMTINCEIGETVKVRRANGRAWIVGNGTAPPTDDTRAKAAEKRAAEAETKATGYITDMSDGVFVHPADDNTSGWKIADTVELIKHGVSYIWAGLVGTVATIRIGRTDGAHVEIDEDSFVLKNADQSPMFLCESSSNTVQNILKQNVNETVWSGTPKAFTLGFIPTTGTSIMVQLRPGGQHTFVAGTASTITKTTFSIAYDGGVEITVTVSSGSIHVDCLRYSITTVAPIFQYGDALGDAAGYSASLGHGLTASGECQTVIGRYNEPDTNGDYAFIIGNGTRDDHTANAYTVDWNGNLDVAGNYKRGGRPIIETATASESTGSLDPNDYANVVVVPSRPSGKTLAAIAAIHVTGTGSSNCMLVGFYIDGDWIRVQVKNKDTVARTWSIEATGLYI